MADYTWMAEQPILDFFRRYSNASPSFCALCEDPPNATAGPLVETAWGWLHEACALSEPPADYDSGEAF
jgi:hypothetical protein